MLPNNIREIISRKDAYIFRAEGLISKELVAFQNQVLTELVKTMSGLLDISDGVILNTPKNYRIVSEFERVISELGDMNANKLTGRIITSANKIGDFNTDYFKLTVSGDMLKRFDKVVSATNAKMLGRLGYIKDRVVSGGFLDSFARVDDMVTGVNELVIKAVTSQSNMSTLISGLEEYITGGDNMGAMERKLKGFAHDIYQQYDASYSVNMADEFGLNYFIYMGGVIEDTRDMCREFNNMIFNKDEVDFWKTWTPAKAYRISEFKQKDVYAVPSYINYAGYNPLSDRGGYNCRHSLAWISDEMALKQKNRWYKV
jgi:hypothetical protein